MVVGNSIKKSGAAMDKYTLSKYVMICNEIRTLQAEKESLMGGYIVAARTTELPSGSRKSDPTAKMPEKVESIAAKIDRQLNRCMALRYEIEEAINKLENPTERLLMRKRYIEGKTWDKVAVEMNYTFRHIIRMHGQILQKMK